VLKRIALAVPAIRRLREARDALIVQRDMLTAQLTAGGAGPFFNFHALFDPIATIHRHALPAPVADPRFLTNFLGVRIDPKFFPRILDDRGGEVEPVPIPANWHADIAEWGAALRAVDLARGRFTVVELGCGWGCWLNNTGVAARRTGLDVRLVGIEGDEGHLGFAREALASNGFAPAAYALHHGIAAGAKGVALFPIQPEAGVAWGLEPVFDASAAEQAAAVASGRYAALPMVSLPALAEDLGRIDLLHVDIQGGEAELVAASLPALARHVAYLVIGTHSRQIEGRLFDTLLGAGWRLEIERPAILGLDDAGPQVTVDGVQGWRNLALLP